MKRLIRKMLIGETVFSPYSKITMTGDIREKAYLRADGNMLDISESHWILCIEPLVFAVWIKKETDLPCYAEGAGCQIYFSDSAQRGSERIRKNAEAILSLDFFDRIEEKEGVLLLLKVKRSDIYHLSFLKNYLLFYRYYRGPGMSFGRFKSFASAYSYPRRVRLVSFRQDEYYNIFPMDLLGEVPGCNRYVFGLRHTNTALPRIIATGKLAVSEVPSVHKEIIYGLGKHHSGSPPPLESLPFKVKLTRQFGFFIPDWVESYKEIRIGRTLDLGSHMLLWGEIIEEEIMTAPAGHLFFIHFLHYLHQKEKGLEYSMA